MKLKILGPRVLCRNYELPEESNGIIIPESYRNVHDGKLFEVVAVGDMVGEILGVVAESGETLAIGLRADLDIPPLALEPDDIIRMKGIFRGQHSPEMSRFLGYDVWFVDVIEWREDELGKRLTPVCLIQTVFPSKHWKQEAA